jgi:hypothetical protein
MNNPKTRDDDERSSVANQKPQSNETAARRGVEGGEADRRSQSKLDEKRAEKSQNEGPAAYAPHPDEPSSADEARKQGKDGR